MHMVLLKHVLRFVLPQRIPTFRPLGPKRRLGVECLEGRLVPAPVVSVADAEVIEPDTGSKTALVHVRLSEPSQQQIAVYWTTADGTAKDGTDYAAARSRID